MLREEYKIRSASLSDANNVFSLGNASFSDEWSIGEVAEVLFLSHGFSLMVTSGARAIGFLLGLPFYVPQIPLVPPTERFLWTGIENVGRIAYVYIAPEWRGGGVMDQLLEIALEAHHAAGNRAVAGTVLKLPKRYKPTYNYFKKKGFLPFDNFGYEMSPQYEYLYRTFERSYLMTQKRTLSSIRPKRTKREIFCRPLSILEENQSYIIFDSESGALIDLNHDARRIYHLCDGKHSVREIAEELYPDTSGHLHEKVADMVLNFKKYGWIAIEEEADCNTNGSVNNIRL